MAGAIFLPAVLHYEWILEMYEFGVHEFCLASPECASSYTET